MAKKESNRKFIKKQFILISIILTLIVFMFSSCESQDIFTDTYFNRVYAEYDCTYDGSVTGGPYAIIYDTETKVMYFVSDGKMSPLYNADGSLKLYR